jgi:hypothetical protein
MSIPVHRMECSLAQEVELGTDEGSGEGDLGLCRNTHWDTDERQGPGQLPGEVESHG